jgi:hypothetical protein
VKVLLDECFADSELRAIHESHCLSAFVGVGHFAQLNPHRRHTSFRQYEFQARVV